MKRAVALAAVAGLVLVANPRAARAQAPRPCTPRVLVLSAFPAELDAVMARARFRPRDALIVDHHTFYPGRLGRHRVLMAMTGIGPTNARRSAEVALGHFRCIAAVVFSGVAGSPHYIGDVTVPARWTGDDGKTWTPADPALLTVARQVAADRSALLVQDDNPVVDPACPCPLAALLPGAAAAPVHLPHRPEVIVGGDGYTSDPFGGRALPCFPGGGDVFGCRPCHARGLERPDLEGFVTGILPFVGPDFFLSYLSDPEVTPSGAAAADEETAAVAVVAAARRLPFIAFRAVSDGQGDPLMLPGFPFQFFAYRLISAHNAAAATAAFLQRWASTT